MKDYDMVMLACPPARELDRLNLGIVEFTPGPDCQETDCEGCGMKCLIGPKLREKRAKHRQAKVLCYLCAVTAQKTIFAPVVSAGGVGATYKTVQDN